MDEEQGGVIAMVTDRDIAMATYLNSKPLWDIPVSTAQVPTAIVCRQPGDDLESVESSMQAHQLHRIPVTGDGGELLGIVSLNDLARAYASGNKAVEPKGLCDALAAVCQPSESAGTVAAA
ncbi:MAG: CBS domain-containing protein [Halioglobus sp.]|nr:CBS domain-containing protein [Halioglobus sp.]